MKSTLTQIIPILLVFYSLTALADNASQRDPTLGGVEFERSCAICHGFDGKGKGVMSDSLKKKPSDLTVLAKNNNGHFPFNELYRTIEGSSKVGVHGSREMPIWGDRYRQEAEEYNELAKKYHEITQQSEIDEYLYSRGLILDLIVFIMSIQEK